MARTPMTFSKRQREQAKRDKKTAKAERKALRKSGALPTEGDPDLEFLEGGETGENEEENDSSEENSTERAVAQ